MRGTSVIEPLEGRVLLAAEPQLVQAATQRIMDVKGDGQFEPTMVVAGEHLLALTARNELYELDSVFKPVRLPGSFEVATEFPKLVVISDQVFFQSPASDYFPVYSP